MQKGCRARTSAKLVPTWRGGRSPLLASPISYLVLTRVCVAAFRLLRWLTGLAENWTSRRGGSSPPYHRLEGAEGKVSDVPALAEEAGTKKMCCFPFLIQWIISCPWNYALGSFPSRVMAQLQHRRLFLPFAYVEQTQTATGLGSAGSLAVSVPSMKSRLMARPLTSVSASLPLLGLRFHERAYLDCGQNSAGCERMLRPFWTVARSLLMRTLTSPSINHVWLG